MIENNYIYRIFGTEYMQMTKRLLRESSLASGIEKGARVGIKPNLVSPTPACYGATTHPEVVAGIIEYLQENDINNIVMIEGSWVGDKTADAYEYCGYRELSEKYGVPFIDTQKDTFSLHDCNGMDINICDSVSQIEYMINVPVIKGHGQTKITCALKNMKGLIPNTEKRLFHRMGLHRPVAHLNLGIKQNFIVIDHICGDLTLEDGGNPVVKNCIMCASDPVLVDSYVSFLLGFEKSDIPYIGMAEDLGVGSGDLNKLKLATFKLDEREGLENASILSINDPDVFESRIEDTDRLVEIRQAIDEVDSCSACYGSLSPALLRIKEEGLLDSLLNNLSENIAIGQGYRGQVGDFGIGNCCRNFKDYVPGCPPKEENVYKKLKNIALNGK